VSARFKAQGLQAPDGMALRAGKWDLPTGIEPRAVCILLQGLGEFLEKYDEVAEELNARGFYVVSLDWRSQGASERGGRDNRVAHVRDFDEYDHDLSILIQRLAGVEQLPLIALAHSTGAHILLRYLSEHKRRLRCAVLAAPLFDIVIEKHPPWLVGLLLFVRNLWKASPSSLPGTDERDPIHLPFEGNRLTSDRARYERTIDKLTKQPFLRINGPSYGWLRAAFRSIRRVRKKDFAEGIVTPLLIFGAGKDQIVRTDATRDYVKWLPSAEYIEFADSEHEILMENDTIRRRFWNAFDAFVEKQLTEQPSGFFSARGSDQS